MRQALEGLNSDVGKKLDKEEVEPLKHYLEKRMEAMKPKPIEKPPPEELAAGIRKQFLVNHNCISCDRPVKYAREGTFPPLPTMHSMPGSKSNHPYTTFELEQIRQHMLQGGLAVTKERFELLERQRNKLQKEILRLRYENPHTGKKKVMINLTETDDIWWMCEAFVGSMKIHICNIKENQQIYEEIYTV